MKIVRHAPITRGVTDLMYVGDDDAVDKVTSSPDTLVAAAGVFGALAHIFGATKTTRRIGGYVAIGSVALLGVARASAV